MVLLHGGEFGGSAELGWERNIAALAAHYRVLAPDQLGFGQSAKVIDFVDGRGMRIRHVARFCELLGIDSAHFVGNSMGAINLFTDATSDTPLLPIRTLVAICGGGEIQQNRHFDALQQYDATLPAMRRIVEALFYDPAYPADEDYVRRRYESSTAPGAWEAVPGFVAPTLRRPRPRRARGPTSASTSRRLSWKGETTNSFPPAGPPRSRNRSTVAIRWWWARRVTARKSSSPQRSTSCCSTFSRPPEIKRRSPAGSASRRLGGRCCGSATSTIPDCWRPARRAFSAWAAR